MQQVTINGDIYEIPISWSELNYWQACQVINLVGDKGKQLSMLAKIPMQLIDIMPNDKAHLLFDIISFTENLEVFESDTVLDEFKDFDFGNIEYGKAEKVKQLMSREASGFEVSADAIKYLMNKDINEMPFLEVIGTANFFLSKLIVSIIVSPSLVTLKQAMNKSKQVLTDYKNLVVLERMLSLQGVEQSEVQ
jgi:hypothetical protein